LSLPCALTETTCGMMMLFLDRSLVPVLYSFCGHREPPAGSGDLAH
jgi:hypothetical protein